ncbi:MAG: type VI secretion system baseplate subunit TssE [Pirellulales bacterium]
MASEGRPELFLPSLLDRLIDDQPDVSTEPAWRQAASTRELEQSVVRDVEALLNTRCGIAQIPPGCPELACSGLTYGLPDFTAVGIASFEERDRIRRAIQKAIETFEPRLSQVRVVMSESGSDTVRSLRLRIEAVMKAYPEPITVMFDTTLEPTSGVCKVETT